MPTSNDGHNSLSDVDMMGSPTQRASTGDVIQLSVEHYRMLEQLAAMSRGLLDQNNTFQTELASIREQLSGNRQTSDHSSPTVSKNTMKARAPTPFSGDKRHELDTFLSQCRICFLVNPESFPNEGHKVLYAGSYLEGTAYSWFEPLLRLYEAHHADSALFPNSPAQLSSFSSFSTALTAMFGDPDLRRSKLRELQNLEQTSSVAAYSAEFQRLQPYIGWDDQAFYDQFYKGLRSNVKDDLAKFEKATKTLEGLMARSLQVDIRIAERLAERRHDSGNRGPPASNPSRPKPSTSAPRPPFQNPVAATPKPPVPPAQFPAFTPDGTTPMVIDMGRRFPQRNPGPRTLTPEEREHRMANLLCIFCGSSDHFKAQCPERARSEQRRAQYAAMQNARRAAMMTPNSLHHISTGSDVSASDFSTNSENLSTQE